MVEIGVGNITPLNMIEDIVFKLLLLNNHNKQNIWCISVYTLILLKIYTTLQYRTLQYNFIQTSTCQGIIKNEIILLNII